MSASGRQATLEDSELFVTVFFLISLIAGLFCVGGFLWSTMEGKPKSIWLIGAGATIVVGIAGLVLHSHS